MNFFRNWLKLALKKGSPSAKGKVQRNRRLILECLEGRETPAAFTLGDIAIYRVGDGTSALASSTGAAVFIDEYTPTGTLVQSIAMPTSSSGSSNALVASGTATSEGLMTRSADGRYLVFAGYKSSVGTTPLTNTTSSATPRVVGRVDVDSNIDTSTALTDFSSANNPRGVASNTGSSVYVSGGAGGIRYATIGATTSTQLNSSLTNTRALVISSGQLYFSTSSGSTYRTGTVGTGLPTTTTQTLTNLPGLPISTGDPYSFFFADLSASVSGDDTLYVADSTAGTVIKYSLNSGTWASKGTIAASGVTGVTGTVSNGTVTLYASASGNLFKVTDSNGYNAAPSTTTATSIATPGTNQAFRGVALAPTSTSTISGATTAAAFTTTYGTASAAQSFTVSGSQLTANLVATAPTGFEVSSDGTTYGSTATFTQSGGSVSGTLSIRLSATAIPGGSYNSKNISLTSTGTSTVNIVTAATGNTVSQKSLTVTGLTGQNKTYDGLTTATATGAAALSGFVGSDNATLGGTPSFTFSSAGVGTGKSVSTTGYTISGGQSSYYTLTQPTLSANITAAPLTITANDVNKAFGATLTSGSGSTAFTSNGLQNSETIGSVTITYGTGAAAGDAPGTYNNSVTPSAATGGTFTGSNYSITYVTGTITVIATPSISSNGTLSAVSTTYGTATASPSSVIVSGGNLTGDLSVSVPSGFEVSKDGTNYSAGPLTLTATSGTVSNTTIYVRLPATASVSGSPYSGNLSISGGGATTVNVSIPSSTVTPKALTISGISIANKEYDQGTSATITGTAAYSGLVNSESFSVTGTPTAAFADKNVATGISVTVSGYTAPSSNYSISQPTGLTANITAKAVTVPDAAVTGKTYNGTTAAVITGTLSGVISGDTVSFNGSGTFASANAGTGISVTSTSSLGGTDAGNYSLTPLTGLTGDIAKANQTITFGALPTKTTNDSSFTLGATTPSGLTITYTSSNTSVATVSGNTVTIIGIGSTTITASQAGDGNYNAATDVGQNFTVTKALAAGDLAFIQYDADNPDKFTFVNLADLEAGMVINFTDNGFASATTGTTNEGFLTFTVPAATTYTSGTTFTWSNGMTISGTPWSSSAPTNFAFNASGDQLFAFQGTTSSWASQSGINLVGGLIQRTTWLTTGTASAAQSYQPSGLSTSYIVDLGSAENGYFANGTSVVSTVTVSDTKPNLQSLFNNGANKWYTNATGPLSAPSYSISLKQSQTITFNSLADKTYGDSSFDLAATASSGLSVSYVSSDTSVATISGTTVTILKAGQTTITASQAGNSTYGAATPVQRTLNINKADQTITWPTPSSISLGAAVSASQLNATVAGVSSGSPAGALTYSSPVGTVLPAGTNSVTVTAASTTNYNQATLSVNIQVNAYYGDPNPSSGNGFGTAIVTLTNGNVVITAPLDDAGATDAGAVYLYSGATGALISTLVGSHANDNIGFDGVLALTNGNYVIRSSRWDNGSATDAGAVTFGSAVTGVSGTLSSTNSLVGSTTDDHVGKYAITALKNGNYVVPSLDWDNGSVTDAGAVTFGNGSTGISGVIAASNSLVGSHNNDKIGSVGITELTNGNYVARSDQWDGAKGAATWANGLTGTSGTVDGTNSIVGSTANDLVGGGTVGILGNGNLVFTSPHWHNSGATDSGAATWMNGSNGKTIENAFGAVSTSNSLVGSSSRSGDAVGLSAVTVLKNNNYVIVSANWNGVRGAATWGDGASAVVGEVSSSNSLVGDVAGANVGSGGVTGLANSNYLVNSMNWSTNKGAVTFGNGLTGKTGTISSSTSLVGTVDNSYVGYSGVTELSQGNFVVGSSKWNDGTNASVGAATFGSGTSGITGEVSSSNSLVGSQTNDLVGSKVTALKNGNYAVVSSTWANGSNTGAGAVTFGSGTTGVSSAVSASNSLVGSSADDQLGGGGIKELSNGNFLVVSPLWNNSTTADAGAVTWVNGTSGLAGSLSSSNSLVGTHTNDKVGSTSITVIPNGNYVVVSSNWDNDTTADVGAATWGNGSTGTSGNVGSGNSFVGTSANDQVGIGGVTVLSNNHFVVSSPNWNNGAVSLAGAVTWGNGSSGGSGAISSSNSLVGSTANDQIGSGGVTALIGNGNYVVSSPLWDSGSTINVGAVTFVNGANGSTVGSLTSSNSLVGSTAGDKVGDGGVTALASGNYLVKSSLWNNGGSLANAGAVTLGLGSSGISGSVSSSNSTVGSVANAGLQAITLNLGNTGYLVRFLNDGASSRVSYGFQNPTAPVFTSATTTTFTVGAAGTFTFIATGSPKPAFSLVSGNLPSGVTLNSTTGVLSGTPGAGSAGTYNLTIRATNGLVGIFTDLAFTLTVS